MTELDCVEMVRTLNATLPGLALQACGGYRRACAGPVRSLLLRQRAALRTGDEGMAKAAEVSIANAWDAAGKEINGLVLSQGAEDEL